MTGYALVLRHGDWLRTGYAERNQSFDWSNPPSLQIIPDEVREFAQAIIGNLIPTILIFVLAYVLLYRQIQRLRSEQEAERLAGKIADIVGAEVRKIGESSRMVERSGREPLLLTDLDWLHEGNDILRVEAEIRTEVWIVSPHLLNDTGMQYEGTLDGYSTVQIAQENLRKNVRYTFVVPDTDQIRVLLPQLRRNYNVARNKPRIVLIPPDIFQALTVTEVAIYDPDLKDHRTPLVFMELPVAIAHNFWAQLDDVTAAAFVTRVRKIIEEYPVS